MTFAALVDLLTKRSVRARVMVGVVGPPGCGKSTLAAQLCDAIAADAVVVPMDGFHLAQRVLDDLGLGEVKGAPQTFDAAGFITLLDRIRHQTDGGSVYAPAFDREIEEPIANAIEVRPDHAVVIVEGNYLLLDGVWSPVAQLLDISVYVVADDQVRRTRLIDRHVAHGRTRADAAAWVDRSDERNAALIATTRPQATYTITVD